MNLDNLVLFDTEKSSASDQAQEFAWDAMDEFDPKNRRALANKALELSEDCADAYCILAGATSSIKKATELYRKAVDAGERAIGPKDFDDFKGRFWGHIETRPFMRAKEHLARCLAYQGKIDEAIKHYEEILKLNPGDNQGIRYRLLICLFRKGKDKKIAELFDQYPGDACAHFYYHRALWLFKKENASDEANEWLQIAINNNTHVPSYLLGSKKIPLIMPEYMQLGEETEAIIYAEEAKADWRITRYALAWLKDSIES